MLSKDFLNIININSDYYELINSMGNPYSLNEIVLDYKHMPVDYRFIEVNSSFETLTNLKREDIIGKNILDILPETKMEWIRLCADVALNQKDLSTQYYSQSLDRYYHVQIQSQKKGIFLTIYNDITSLKQAYHEEVKQRKSYESLFNTVSIGLIRTSIDEGRIIKANPTCTEIFGYDTLDEFMKTPVIDLYKDPEDRKHYRAKLLQKGKLNNITLQMKKLNNKQMTLAVSSSLHYKDNLPVWIDSTIQDISKQQRAEEKLEINSILFEHTLEAVVISDENHKILTVNKAFSKITGYTKKEVIGKDFNLLCCKDKDKEKSCIDIINMLKNKGSWQGEVNKRHKNGEEFPAHLSVIEGEKSKGVKHYISIFDDITYRKQSQENLYQLAHSDQLTQLSNRHAFMHRLNENVEKAKRYKSKCALIFMDLDGFKKINDTYGHNAGDIVLVRTAERLKHIIRKSDMVARMGGDEFTVIIENFSDIRDLTILCKKIIKSISEEIQIEDAVVEVTTSIGISIYPDDAVTPELILTYADNAMYRAKKLGKNNVQFFTKELNIDSVNQMIFEMELRHALEKDEMNILYQPRISLASNAIIGFEVFISWENETYGKIPQEVFLPIAMKSSLINEILSWLITTSTSQVKRWQHQFKKDFILSLSLPEKDFTLNEHLEQILEILKEQKFKPEFLHLQIKQNSLMRENQLLQLQYIHKLGIKLILENFGSGVSSIADLYKIPLDAIKLDKIFTHKDTTSDKRVLQALVHLVHSLKADIIADEIEDIDTLESLENLNFQQAQGNALYTAKGHIETMHLLEKTFP